jgi:hypothetical protein
MSNMTAYCDCCGRIASVFKIIETQNLCGVCMCERCLEKKCEMPYVESSKKKRLHPALSPNTDSEHPEYESGFLDFPDRFSLSITWDKKEESWQISNDCVISDSDMIEFLSLLYSKIPESFSDELEISYQSLTENYPSGHIFWTYSGEKWMLSDDKSTSIQLRNDSQIPTGKVKTLDMNEMIYTNAIKSV